MKPLLAGLAVALLAAAAYAQPAPPAGGGIFAFKEKLKTSCGSASGDGMLSLSIAANSSWSIDGTSLDLTGTLAPVGTKGTTWELVFDGGSEGAYEGYLEAKIGRAHV